MVVQPSRPRQARPYQQELLELAKQRNCIINLPTGSGKTYIAILLMKHFSSELRGKDGKRTFFLVPTQPLVAQHAKAIRGLGRLKVVEFTGNCRHEGNLIDCWDMSVWEQKLADHEVIVLTRQIFLDAIKRAFIPWTRINLLIFDEAHHAGPTKKGKTTNDPYTAILKLMKQLPHEKRPRILGLSASIVNTKIDNPQKILQMVEHLETSFEAPCITCSPGLLGKHHTNPKEELWVYPSTCVPFDCRSASFLLDATAQCLAKVNRTISLDAAIMRLIKHERRLMPGEKVPEHPVLSSLPTSIDDLQNCVQSVCDILHGMGPWSALSVVSHYKEKLSKTLDRFCGVSIDYDQILKAIIRLFECCEDIFNAFVISKTEAEDLFRYVSSKMLAILQILKRFKCEQQDPLCGIIFVEKRVECKALCEWLQAVAQRAPKAFGYLSVDFVVGTSAQQRSKTFVANTSPKAQKATLANFHAGTTNLVVATSVLEEGLDVPKCNLVVKYDLPKTFREWIQSKGRARDKDGWYILMCEDVMKDDAKYDICCHRDVERLLTKLGRNHQNFTDEVVEEYYVPAPTLEDEEDLVSSIEARVTLNSSKAVVQMYCDKLLSDVFTRSVPVEKFEIMRTEGFGRTELFRCHVQLPLSSAITESVAGPWKRSRELARQCTYLKICRILYKCGQLNEYLLPKKKKDIVDQIAKELGLLSKKEMSKDKDAGTKKRRLKYARAIHPLLENRPASNDLLWTLFVVKISKKYETPNPLHEKGLGFLSVDPDSGDVVDGCTFPIFHRNGPVDVEFKLQSEIRLSPYQFNLLQKFSEQCILKALRFDQRDDLNEDSNGVASYFFVPLTNSNQIDWNCISAVAVDRSNQNVELTKDFTNYEDTVVWTLYEVQGRRKTRYYRVLKVDYTLSPRSKFDTDEYDTFLDYYKNKRHLEIKDLTQPLLWAEIVSAARFRINPRHGYGQLYASEPVHLIPELCKTTAIPALYWFKLMAVPAIVFRLNNLLIARRFKDLVEQEVFNNKLRRTCEWPEFTLYAPNSNTSDSFRVERLKPISQPSQLPKKVCTEEDLDAMDEQDETVENFPPTEVEDSDETSSEEDDEEDEDEDEEEASEMSLDDLKQALAEAESESESNPQGAHSEISPSKIPVVLLEKPDRKYENDESYLENPIFTAKYPKFSQFQFSAEIVETVQKHFDKLLQSSVVFEHKEDEDVHEHADFLVDLSMSIEKRIESLDRGTKTNPPEGPDTLLVLQALTARSVRDFLNLERLETIGDSFLKLVTCCFLYFKYPMKSVDVLVPLKDRQLCNLNLFRLAQEKDLATFLDYEKFHPLYHYIPPGYAAVEHCHTIPDKTVADCVEALIGAYLVTCGPVGAAMFMDWIGLSVTTDKMDVNSYRWLPDAPPAIPTSTPDAKQAEEVVALLYNRFQLDRFEEVIGYRFKNKGYLVQAFTHVSYYCNNVTPCYERLEFLGDAVLDYLVTRYIYEDKPRDFSPGELTHLRQALVNNGYFGCMAVKYGFHKHLMLISHDAFNAINAFVSRFKADPDPLIHGSFMLVTELETSTREQVDIPKILGDIFESVAGAIYLDSGLSLDVTYEVYYRLMKDELQKFSEEVPIHPVRYLHELSRGAEFSRALVLGPNEIQVTVTLNSPVPGYGHTFLAIGKNRRCAKRAAAKRALWALKYSSKTVSNE